MEEQRVGRNVFKTKGDLLSDAIKLIGYKVSGSSELIPVIES